MNAPSRRTIIAGAAALAATPVRAQQAGLVTIVVPFATGGSTDALARLIQPGLQARVGRTVIVENKPGAASSIGANQVARSTPDGSTFLITFDSHAVIPALLAKPALDVEKDLTPIMLVGTAPYVLAAAPGRPYKRFADAVAAEKAKAGTIKYASTGLGTIGHLAMSTLAKQAGVELAHVAYRSGGLAMNDALGGHVDMICGSVALLLPQIADGKLQPLMQFGRQRLDVMKSTETAIEAGFKDFEALAWWGVFGPKGMSGETANRVAGDLKAVLSDDKISTRLKETQQMTLALSGPAELDRFFKGEVAKWGAVVRETGIKPE